MNLFLCITSCKLILETVPGGLWCPDLHLLGDR